MSGSNILSIDALAVRDETIIKKEIYQYAPYTSSFGESDEIRIAIQSKDSYLLPCESYIYLQVACTTNGVQPTSNDISEIKFIKNYASFLFTDARYELNGVEIDRVRNVGLTSTMKLLTASRRSQLDGYHKFSKTFEATSPRGDAVKVYDVVLPLSVWFGFCDDYRKIILNCKHELILNRSRQSLDCTRGGDALAASAVVKIDVRKIEWKMPHITLSDRVKLNMLNYLSKNRKIIIQHRSMDMTEYPQLPQTTSHMWSVKTVSHVNRPRFVIVGLQTGRKGKRVIDASNFDPCNVTDVRLHLNSQIYPYNMNELDIGGGIYAELYSHYANAQSTYYNNVELSNPFLMGFTDFQKSPLFVFDTSRADESVIDSSIDVRVEIKTRENILADTSAYCLIIYDSEFTYSPFDGIVVRNV